MEKMLETAYRVRGVLFARFDGHDASKIVHLCRRATRASLTEVYTTRETDGRLVIEQSSFTGEHPVMTLPVRKGWYVVWDFSKLEVIPRGMFLRNYLLENPLGNKKRKEVIV